METEPRDIRSVRGASGFVHPILAAGVDEGRKRTLIVSGDPDARTAALAQADIALGTGHLRRCGTAFRYCFREEDREKEET
jgi:hypothetical protein